MNQNPFITSGYVSPEYFCDREQESAEIIMDIEGRNNKVMISPRRMGKTGLILHCFHKPELSENYYCFFIDIYSTLNLSDFIVLLGNKICEVLKPKGKNAVEAFCRIVRSLEFRISFDSQGLLEASFGIGDIKDPQRTLDEIFSYINTASKRCVVAIDEFQQISKYPEAHTEALLRTYVQHCPNASFIFAGSQRHMLQNMFFSASKPFYHSASVLSLKPIPLEKYSDFIIRHFRESGKRISAEEVAYVYELFEGHTWYIQYVLNRLYEQKEPVLNETIFEKCLADIVRSEVDEYQRLYGMLTENQSTLLRAIARERFVAAINSSIFIKKYGLKGSSSINAALKFLVNKEYVFKAEEGYCVYDRFMELWLQTLPYAGILK